MQITMKCKNATRISFQLTCFYFKRKPSFNDTRQFCGHRYYVAILWLGRALLRQVQNSKWDRVPQKPWNFTQTPFLLG